MVSDLGGLIARYEAAHQRVMEIVEQGSDSDAELLSADKALASAFDDILQAELVTSEDSLLRVNFLLQQIKSNQMGNKLVERLADQVWQDVTESKKHLPKEAGDLPNSVLG